MLFPSNQSALKTPGELGTARAVDFLQSKDRHQKRSLQLSNAMPQGLQTFCKISFPTDLSWNGDLKLRCEMASIDEVYLDLTEEVGWLVPFSSPWPWNANFQANQRVASGALDFPQLATSAVCPNGCTADAKAGYGCCVVVNTSKLWSCSFEFQIEGLSLACSVGFSAKATGWHLHWHRCGAKKQHDGARIFHTRCTYVFDSYVSKMCFRFHCPGLSALCEEKSCFHSVVLQDSVFALYVDSGHPSPFGGPRCLRVSLRASLWPSWPLLDRLSAFAMFCKAWLQPPLPTSDVVCNLQGHKPNRQTLVPSAGETHIILQHFMTSSTSSKSSTDCQKLGSFELIVIAKTIQ